MKEIKLSNLTDVSEVAFSVCTLLFFCCYTLNYYFGGSDTAVLVTVILLIISCLVFCILCVCTNYVAKDAMYWDRSHKFLGILRVSNDKYHIPGLLRVYTSYFWRHWIFGVYWKRMIHLALTIVGVGLCCCACYLAIVQHWQFQLTMIPVLVLLIAVLCYYAYRILKLGVFRSGTPVIRYLMHSGESIESICEDFKSSFVVSHNVRIGGNHVFCRVAGTAWIVNVRCISQYELCKNTIIVLPIWGVRAEVLKFQNKHDYDEVARRIIQ